jgi:uncharacterized membrane protein (UPF0127 family)
MKPLTLRMLTITILLMAMGFVQAQRRPVVAEQTSPYQFTDIKRSNALRYMLEFFRKLIY